MPKDKKVTSNFIGFQSAVIFVLTVSLVCLFSYLRGISVAGIISNTVLCGMGCFGVLFLLAQARLLHSLDYDNEANPVRFFVVYLIGLLLAVACAYLPASGWPFVVVFVALALFSNTLIGVCGGGLLLTVALLLSAGNVEVFVLYFLCGIVSAGLFRSLDESYRIGLPLFLSILMLLVAETAGVVLFTNETLKFALFQIPLINVVISAVMLLLVLRIFSAIVIYRYRDKYMEINDPEFPLLVELKDKSKEEYYHGVHTAYFCDRIAKKLSLDADALKTGGYYHRIGLLKGAGNWTNAKALADEYGFPPKACALLEEYLDKSVPARKKETAVLLMADAVVSSICFLFSRNPQEPLDYDKIIETVFRKKMESSFLKDCEISMDEITKMKNIFKEEKLYYDFLR